MHWGVITRMIYVAKWPNYILTHGKVKWFMGMHHSVWCNYLQHKNFGDDIDDAY